MVCLPIKNLVGDILGVIQVLNKREGVFTDSDLELLRALAPQIAIAIENAVLFEEQNQQWRSILEVLAASIDAKDPLTAGHSEKVAEYALGIARELGLGEVEMDSLHVAALLHDYGKIGVSDAVLKKPGKLTAEEFEHIKTHIPRTQGILGKMRFMRKYRNVPMIASCHHERLDGTGYSAGLKAHEIPFMAKILAVADVFEALTAKRHYRDALSAEEAFRMLEQDVGSKYDGNIVDALKCYWSKLSSTS
jgi:HD-GYP domain-containing protein (c-di-GMP phosphodiesterase class II)